MGGFSPILPREIAGEPATPPPFRELGSAAAPVGAQVELSRMQQLERMLREVQGRSELIERETYDKAYAAGEKAGLALGRKRAEQSLQELSDTLAAADAQLRQMERQLSEAAIDIAELVLAQLLGEVTRSDRARLLASVRRAATLLPHTEGLSLALHPDEIEAYGRLLGDEQPHNRWRLLADPTLAPGSCRLLSRHNDLTIDPQQALGEAMAQVRLAFAAPASD